MNIPEQYVTINETTKRQKIHPETVKHLCREKSLPLKLEILSLSKGTSWRFLPELINPNEEGKEVK